MLHTLYFNMRPSIHYWIMGIAVFWKMGSSGGHEIVDLVVPVLADPRENATLSCRYRMGSDLLYSAKWFKDDQEIFRYMPGQQPAGLPFPLVGVQLSRVPRCSPVACDLEMTELVPQSAGHYRCEVSTEAPTFRIVHKSANMTIAALSRKDPRIEGVSSRYSLGEDIRANCSSDPALPPWELTWFVNDIEASFLNVEGPWHTPAGRGLSRTVLSLRLPVERSGFKDGELRLRCSAAAPPGLPGGPYRRQAVAVATLQPPAFLDKLAWPGSLAGRVSSSNLLITTFLISLLALRRFFTC